ncbi:phosphatidate cytidylyltransferase [candidate division KSB1 bacterium]|nr:phosphatidate cytidylyltransferase [candidate division KSB1 bacterium]
MILKLKNLALRVLVAIFGIPLILGTIYYGRLPFLAVVLLINVVSQYEFYKLCEKKDSSPLKIVGIITGIFITLSFYFHGLLYFWEILIIGVVVSLLAELVRGKSNATNNFAATITGVIYPVTLFAFLILIREYPKHVDIQYEDAGLWLIFVVVTIWICDTAAYFVGSMIGKHKLSPRVSPNKTVEGAIAGFIFSFITAYVFYLLYPNLFGIWHYMIIAAIVGIFAQVGDLVESIFKRDAGIKDSSSILPGHGGFLDRFDAPTFLAPIIYLYLIFFVF